MVKRPGNSHQFETLPRRWVVEGTLEWLCGCRRLSKDYEALPDTTEAWVRIAMIHLMLRRLGASVTYFGNTLLDNSTGHPIDAIRNTSWVEAMLHPLRCRGPVS